MTVTLMQEKQARAYCAEIASDPDEVVWGLIDTGLGYGATAKAPRWQWYVGARCNALHADPVVSLGEAADRVLSTAPISLRNPPHLSLV